LYGICDTAANGATKSVTLASFDAITHGVTVFVKFTNGNSVSSGVKLAVGGTSAYDVAGSCVCNANDVISFTFDDLVLNNGNWEHSDVSTNWRWRVDGVVVLKAGSGDTPTAVSDTAAVGSSDKYARADHVHNIVVATGDANGQVKVAGQNVSVAGLGSAAYTDSTAYAGATHSHSEYLEKSGGTMTGPLILDASPTSTSNPLTAATKQYVDNEISSVVAGAVDAMMFKGTIGAAAQNPTVTALPDGSLITYKVGDTYKVVTAGNYGTAGTPLQCEVGDLLIAIDDPATGQNAMNPAHWTVAQGNIDGAVTGPAGSTADHVATFNDASGKVIKDSGFTIGKSVPSGAVFTDTTYALTDGSAYTSHTLTGDTGASILASVSLGVLTLAEGIKFTTANVGTSITPTVTGSNS